MTGGGHPYPGESDRKHPARHFRVARADWGNRYPWLLIETQPLTDMARTVRLYGCAATSKQVGQGVKTTAQLPVFVC